MSSTFEYILEAARSLPSDEQMALAEELLAENDPDMEAARKILATKKADDGGPDYGGLIARDKSPEEYRRRTAQAIAEGIESIKTGRGYTPEEVRAMIPQWISESFSKTQR